MFFLGQSDEYGRQHSEYICLDKCYQQLQRIHKDVEQHRGYGQRTINAGPMLAEIKMRHVNTSIAMCPANMLAKDGSSKQMAW